MTLGEFQPPQFIIDSRSFALQASELTALTGMRCQRDDSPNQRWAGRFGVPFRRTAKGL